MVILFVYLTKKMKLLFVLSAFKGVRLKWMPLSISEQKCMRYLFFLALTFCLFSCKKQDELNPVIRFIRTNGGENDSLRFFAGQENTIVIAASDKEGLSQMKIEISTLTGLQMEHIAPVSLEHVFLEVNQGSWDTLRIANLQGNDVERQFEFAIPSTIHGKWNLKVTVIDKSGNITEEERDIFMVNDKNPKFDLTSIVPVFEENGRIQMVAGDTVKLTGQWLDLALLDLVRAEILNETDVFWSQEFSAINASSFDLNQLVSPPILSSGKYLYVISARNSVGLENKVQAELIVE